MVLIQFADAATPNRCLLGIPIAVRTDVAGRSSRIARLAHSKGLITAVRIDADASWRETPRSGHRDQGGACPLAVGTPFR